MSLGKHYEDVMCTWVFLPVSCYGRHLLSSPYPPVKCLCEFTITCSGIFSNVYILSSSHPQHANQASSRHMLETSTVQSALRIVSAMEKGLLSAAVRRASSGRRKILHPWLVHVSIPANRGLMITYDLLLIRHRDSLAFSHLL